MGDDMPELGLFARPLLSAPEELPPDLLESAESGTGGHEACSRLRLLDRAVQPKNGLDSHYNVTPFRLSAHLGDRDRQYGQQAPRLLGASHP